MAGLLALLKRCLRGRPSPGHPNTIDNDKDTSGAMVTTLRIYLVRHGETAENKEGIIQGQLDTRLNETGVEQARRVAGVFKSIPLAAAFSSDLERARKTAEAIMIHHPNVQLRLQPELRERFMGDLQGVKVDTHIKLKRPESAEGGEAFSLRALNWWNSMISTNYPSIPSDADTIHVLVVSHGAFISVLIRTLIAERIIRVEDGTRLGACFNTSVSSIDMESEKLGRLVKYADISHLLAPVVETNADEEPQVDQQ